jgi:LDH2 family malate/lactate/ureidoglycolate dehydrogenase
MFGPPESQSGISHAMLVIDVNKMMDGGQFMERLEEYTHMIVDAPKAVGSDKIFYPGEPNWLSYDKAVENGLELPEATLAAVQQLAEMAGLDLQEVAV